MNVDLRECVFCLDCEPEGSKEKHVAKVAKNDLNKIGEILLFADFL